MYWNTALLTPRSSFADRRYADALGSKARHGYQVFARQDFIGIDYGLLDCLTHDPLPDYYVAALYTRLMAPGVLGLITGMCMQIRHTLACRNCLLQSRPGMRDECCGVAGSAFPAE